ASDCVMCQYERPADTSTTARSNRAALGQKYYSIFAGRTAPDKSIPEIALEVLAGLWGDGSERREKLICAGYDYNAVQSEVNKILNQESCTATEQRKYFSISVDGKTYSGMLEEQR
ncbi:MAG: hypothetical protein K2H82_09690, partial [Oscillospiraceae bacterium]|nr:hypothetical protein [Oscillospiraceae bacterium]